MFWISHRGNISGPQPDKENSPKYIMDAIDKGWNVEIDVWCNSAGNFVLGHDKPQYDIDSAFLKHPNIWCHAKNLRALRAMIGMSGVHCFWHQNDDATLTNRGYIWVYHNKKNSLSDHSIAVMPEKVPEWNLYGIKGICSDYIGYYFNKMK